MKFKIHLFSVPLWLHNRTSKPWQSRPKIYGSLIECEIRLICGDTPADWSMVKKLPKPVTPCTV